jgi:hypothetical protein
VQYQNFQIQIKIPRQTRNNGSLFIHAILLPKSYDSVDPFAASWYLVQTTSITTFHIPQAEAFKLMGDSPEDKTSQKKPQTKTVGQECQISKFT